ncbi:MAG TPA: hypothetical protein VFJ94_11590 [Intrasporangium sp.]|uniref:hypothetical protein n=1 Tax=Intrasporangium sp. TaxID=1925024 RepID=UPI002D783EFA|nr:hypothetical protein [Intrasporangium sp.]HET7399150.1 hypothetical protein [Intrasporangium sp.]
MTRFELRLASSLPPQEAWRRVLDLRAHTAVIPLTTLCGDALGADELRPGSRFVARTAVGPVVVDDPMVIDEIEPPSGAQPGVARIRKEGKVIRGWIALRVGAAPGGSEVEWTQEISVLGVPGAAGRVTAAVARVAYGATLRRLLARPGTDVG